MGLSLNDIDLLECHWAFLACKAHVSRGWQSREALCAGVWAVCSSSPSARGPVVEWSPVGRVSCLAGLVCGRSAFSSPILLLLLGCRNASAAQVLEHPPAQVLYLALHPNCHRFRNPYKYLFSGHLIPLLEVSVAVRFSWVFPFCRLWQGRGNGERIPVVDPKQSITLLKGRTWDRLGRLLFSQCWKPIALALSDVFSDGLSVVETQLSSVRPNIFFSLGR